MAHPRKVIRQAVRDALIGATLAGANVFSSRGLPFAASQLPAISVYTLSDAGAEGNVRTAPRMRRQTVRLAIDLAVSMPAGGAVDDALDDLAEQVEAIMDADPQLDGSASDSILESSELGIIETGGRPMGGAQLIYLVEYVQRVADGTLDDLDKVGVSTNLGNAVTPAEQAEDLVTGLAG